MTKFELDKFIRYVPNEELITDLEHVASQLDSNSLTQREYKKFGKFGVTIFYTRFGSWSNALLKASLNRKSRIKNVISSVELISDLKRVAAELENDSITRNEYNKLGKYHSATFEERFGSWIKAKDQAGLKRRNHPSIADEEYFKNLEDVWIKLGRQPHFSDMKIPFSKYSGSGYVHNFGSWRKSLEQFIEYINKDDDMSVVNVKSTINETNIPMQAPATEYLSKETVSDPVLKTPLADSPKPVKEKSDKRLTKREVNDRLRFKIMKRDNFKCKYCGRSPAIDPKIVLHVDHIIPWSKGGETTFENLQTLCSKCNIGKGNLKQ